MRKSFLITWFIFTLILNTSAVFAASYDTRIDAIAKNLAEKIKTSGKKSVAVIDFTDLEGNVSEAGRFFAEELSADLQNKATGFQVADRTLFKGALKARQFSMPGILDAAAIRQIGQIADVDALITGVITPLGDEIRLSCKIIATDSARVMGSVRGDLPGTKVFTALLTNKVEPGAKIAVEPAEKSAPAVAVKTEPVTPPPPAPSVQPAVPVQPAAPVPPAPVKPQTVNKAQVENFTFEMKECRQSGRQVFCTVSVANSFKKQKRLARCATIMTDDKGRKYESAGYARFGEDRSSMWADIRPGEPRQMVHTFENVDPEAKDADIVLDCAYIDSKATFEKIKLTK